MGNMVLWTPTQEEDVGYTILGNQLVGMKKREEEKEKKGKEVLDKLVPKHVYFLFFCPRTKVSGEVTSFFERQKYEQRITSYCSKPLGG